MIHPAMPTPVLTRRCLLQSAIVVVLGVPWPQAYAATSDADRAQAGLIGGRPVKRGLLRLTTPTLAENGATVPVSLDLAGSLPIGTTVNSFHLLSEGNPVPLIASFYFSPHSLPFASVRVRLAQTQILRALAILSDGTVYGIRNMVKVTIGGCGG
jgi:sulfur-oxidizing protein SoxY